jgi:predicted Zn-dependent protease with MMP-like domain
MAGKVMVRVSREQLHRMVERAITALPERFRAALEEVRVEVVDRPTRRQLQSVGLAEDELLLGLYEGTPITERSVSDGPRLPEVIWIFHEDLEDAVETEAELEQEVRVTLLHELGHHFGLDEDELDALGFG